MTPAEIKEALKDPAMREQVLAAMKEEVAAATPPAPPASTPAPREEVPQALKDMAAEGLKEIFSLCHTGYSPEMIQGILMERGRKLMAGQLPAIQKVHWMAHQGMDIEAVLKEAGVKG